MLTKVHVPERLLALGAMEAPQNGQGMYSAEMRLLAFNFDQVLRRLGKVLACLEVLQTVVVGECQGEGEEGVVKHRRIMCRLRDRLATGDRQRAEHVTQKEIWDHAEAPAGEELEQEVEHSVVRPPVKRNVVG